MLRYEVDGSVEFEYSELWYVRVCVRACVCACVRAFFLFETENCVLHQESACACAERSGFCIYMRRGEAFARGTAMLLTKHGVTNQTSMILTKPHK